MSARSPRWRIGYAARVISAASGPVTSIGVRPSSRRLAKPAILLGALSLAALVWLLHEGRKFSFQSDEWDWLLHRRGHSLGVFLRPHNEHLSALPIAAYKLVFQLFGARSTFPVRLIDVVLACTCSVLVYVLVRRRLGPWMAVSIAAVFLFFGPAWNDILWGFQMGYLGSIAAGLGALVALERRDRMGDTAACVLLIAGLACSSVGLPILFGLGVGLLLMWQEERWRRLWIVVVPALLYGLWYSRYGVSSIHLSYIRFVPLYSFHGLAAVSGALTGLTAPVTGNPYQLSLDAGNPIAVLLLLGVAIRVIRGPALPRRFWGAAAVALAFWLAAALSFISGREANSSRYTYPVAPFVVLAATATVGAWRPTRRTAIVMAAGAAVAIVSNLGFLRQGAQLFDITSRFARAELGGMQVARGIVSPAFAPESGAATDVIGVHNMTPITAGPYFSAIDAFGSPADSVPALLREPNDAREAADFVLVQAEGIHLAPPGAGLGQCAQLRPSGGQVELANGAGRLVLRTGERGASAILLRRFADTFHFASIGAMAPRSSVALTLPRDQTIMPWHLRISSAAAVTVCR